MQPLVSIILPVYNGEKYLRESVDSILSQTYRNWELLILDDCSSDATETIALDYVNRDSRVKYYRNNENLRLPRNLNKGFSLSNGDYLTWTSDDNYYYPNAIERMVEEISRDGVEYVIANSIVIDETGAKIEEWASPHNAYECSIGQNVGNACFLYSRLVYEDVGDYNPKMVLIEDFDYWQRICMKYHPVVIDEFLYAYRRHSQSLTDTMNREEHFINFEKMLLKNVDGYGQLSWKQKYYYYNALHFCREKLHKIVIPDEIRNSFYSLLHFTLVRVPNRIRRMIKK